MTTRTPKSAKDAREQEEALERQADEREEELLEKAEEAGKEERAKEIAGEKAEQQQSAILASPFAAATSFLRRQPQTETLEDTDKFKEVVGEKKQPKTTLDILRGKKRVTNEADALNEREVAQGSQAFQEADANLKNWDAKKRAFEDNLPPKIDTAKRKTAIRNEAYEYHGIGKTDPATGRVLSDTEREGNLVGKIGQDRLDQYLNEARPIYSQDDRNALIRSRDAHQAGLQKALDEKYGSLNDDFLDLEARYKRDPLSVSRYDRAFFAARDEAQKRGKIKDLNMVLALKKVFGDPKNDPYLNLLKHRIDMHTLHRFDHELMMQGIKNPRERQEIARLLLKAEKNHGRLGVFESIKLSRLSGGRFKEFAGQFHELHGKVIDTELKRFRALHFNKYQGYYGHLHKLYRDSPHVFTDRSGQARKIIQLFGKPKPPMGGLPGPHGPPGFATHGINGLNRAAARARGVSGGLRRRIPKSPANFLKSVKWMRFAPFIGLLVFLVIGLALIMSFNFLPTNIGQGSGSTGKNHQPPPYYPTPAPGQTQQQAYQQSLQEVFGLKFAPGFSLVELQWAWEKLWDVSGTNFTKFLSGKNITLYPNQDGDSACCSGGQTLKVNLVHFNPDEKEHFDVILIHELSHIIDYSTSPLLSGKYLMFAAIIKDRLIGQSHNGYVTHYGQVADQCAHVNHWNENYADMVAYYLNQNVREQTNCTNGVYYPPTYGNGGHPNHLQVVQSVMGPY